MSQADEVRVLFGPTFRSSLRGNLMHQLFSSQSSKIKDDRMALVREHNRILGRTGNVRHNGRIYRPDSFTPSWKDKVELTPELGAKMGQLEVEEDAMLDEISHIHNYLAVMSTTCKSIADIYYLFPECIHCKFPSKLVELRRTCVSELTISTEKKLAFETKYELAQGFLITRMLTAILLN